MTCTTGPKVNESESKIEFFVTGQGLASFGASEFNYFHKWSEIATWGQEAIPQAGESVYIPKNMNVVFDLEESPILNMVVIEGGLYFYDRLPQVTAASVSGTGKLHKDSKLNFQANIIFINGGKLQAGTEDKPVNYNMNITLHGERFGPKIPLFGNKCITNYGGTLEIHGNQLSTPRFEGTYSTTAGQFSKGVSKITP